jgi:hypothetical protein
MEGEAKTRAPAKYSTDLLSKVWKPLASLTPFYSGGKVFKFSDFLSFLIRSPRPSMEWTYAAFTTRKSTSLVSMMT